VITSLLVRRDRIDHALADFCVTTPKNNARIEMPGIDPRSLQIEKIERRKGSQMGRNIIGLVSTKL